MFDFPYNPFLTGDLLTKGTTKVGAEFKLSSFGFSLTYFLNITINPQVRTLTWTLDYRYNSDFGKLIAVLPRILQRRNTVSFFVDKMTM